MASTSSLHSHQASHTSRAEDSERDAFAVVSLDAEFREDQWRYDVLEVVLPRSLSPPPPPPLSHGQTSPSSRSAAERFSKASSAEPPAMPAEPLDAHAALLTDVKLNFPQFEPGMVVRLAPTSGAHGNISR